MLNKIAIFGVGLIGGSFALAIRRAYPSVQLVGVSRRATTLARALELGIIDFASDSVAAAVADADLVLLAAPVAQTQIILSQIRPHLGNDTVITDAGSTKQDVVLAARAGLGDRIAQFVPGHPIAGRESNGPDAALVDLYVGKKVILTQLPENTVADVERVASAWRQCGAVIHQLTPQQHDQVFAAVSHLPHLLAYALVDNLAVRDNADTLFQYAASGFRDFTRIAGSSPEMWRDISLANRSALLDEVDTYLKQLGRLREMLQRADGAQIEALYANAQRARQDWTRLIESAEQQAAQGGD